MTTTTPPTAAGVDERRAFGGGRPKSASQAAREALSSRGASVAAIVIALLWTLPTFGLFVSSFRPEADVRGNGWWNVFTDPELATVGVSQDEVDSGRTPARQVMLPLSGNARAKMADLRDGFVKLFCRPATGQVIGGVVVAPKASELILPIAMAVENHLTVDQVAQTITIYPSLSGSLAEAARQLMLHGLVD